jgi:hypothetical protein
MPELVLRSWKGCPLISLSNEVNQVADHRRQQLADALDDASVHEGQAGGIGQFQPQAAVDLLHLDTEIAMLLDQGLGVIAFDAAVEDRQRAAAHQFGQVAAADVLQALDLVAAERVQHAGGVNPCGYGFDGQASTSGEMWEAVCGR